MAARLDPTELSALMAAIEQATPAPTETTEAGEGAPAEAEVVPYNLLAPPARPPFGAAAPRLKALGEAVCSPFAEALGKQLGVPVSLTCQTAVPLGPDISAAGLGVVEVSLSCGARGNACLLVEAALARALTGLALGDRGATDAEAVPATMTRIERAVLARLLQSFTGALAQAGAPWWPRVTVAAVQAEASPARWDGCLALPFDLVAGRRGPAWLVLGADAQAALASATGPLAGTRPAGASEAALARLVKSTCVTVSALLGRAHLPLERVLALRVGDVIPLGQAQSAPLTVLVEGRAKLTARARTGEGHARIEIVTGMGGNTRPGPSLRARLTPLPRRPEPSVSK